MQNSTERSNRIPELDDKAALSAPAEGVWSIATDRELPFEKKNNLNQ